MNVKVIMIAGRIMPADTQQLVWATGIKHVITPNQFGDLRTSVKAIMIADHIIIAHTQHLLPAIVTDHVFSDTIQVDETSVIPTRIVDLIITVHDLALAILIMSVLVDINPLLINHRTETGPEVIVISLFKVVIVECCFISICAEG